MIYFNEKSKGKKQVLYDNVFDKNKNADKFIIITGYVGPQMVKDLESLPYKEIILVVGMYGKDINSKLHNSILHSNKNIENLTIYYTNKLVHTKLYAWYKQDELCDLLIGSANFSTNALIENAYRETLYHVKEKASEQRFKEYIEQIFSDMYLCNELNLESKVESKSFYKDIDKAPYSNTICNLSLLASKNGEDNIIGIKTLEDEVHTAAGLNWGYSSGQPSIEDAYIKISTSNIDEAPTLFPTKPKGENQPIEAIWDDGVTMLLLLEGNGKKSEEGIFYPKQIGTYRNKSELGIYLRKRIGDKIGKNLIYSDDAIEKVKNIKARHNGKETSIKKASIIEDIQKDKKLELELKEKFVTLDDLQQYGRTDVSVSILDDGTYYFDFSV